MLEGPMNNDPQRFPFFVQTSLEEGAFVATYPWVRHL